MKTFGLLSLVARGWLTLGSEEDLRSPPGWCSPSSWTMSFSAVGPSWLKTISPFCVSRCWKTKKWLSW